jgi:D-alanyl-D-alanine carboxypeptidase/D-alanyl-D-alanine-endopeptidase (penicillin-binding protein 4)
VRPARDAADRASGRPLAVHGSSTVDSLRVMNRRSQNFYASQLFKAAGARLAGVGSWATGEAAVREALQRRGLDDGGRTRIVDGSGLAKENRTTAATLALLLAQVERDLLRGPVLHDSLAAPGEEGTLDDRLVTRHTRGRLRAKTGTLAQSGVHSLAGYLEGRGDEPGLCFAVLVNKRSWKGDARALIDDLVGILAAP